MKRQILIVNPNIYNSYIYLPAIWGLLKTSCENSEDVKGNYEWLLPIYENYKPEKLLKDVDVSSLDVLGLSCYVWNYGLNLEIAKYVKERNPSVLVVAGGPHPDWSDTEGLFDAHPYIDIVIKNEGEHSFREILLERLKENPQYINISGLFLPNNKFTGDRGLENDFSQSYYLEQRSTYEDIIKKIKKRNGKVFLLHETDRGCMYGCVFCNWGSATMTRVRVIPEQRCFDEIEWAGKMKIDAVENTNANFGHFEKDLTFTKAIVESNKKYGYPKDFWYSSAKSKPDRVFEIAKMLNDNSMLDFQILALQTTNEEIMKNSRRTNLKPEALKTFVTQCRAEQIPIKAQLIRGLPGETIDTWYESIETCLNYGVVEGFHQFPWELLPNSPASEPEYISKWKIAHVERHAHVPRRKKDRGLSFESTTKTVVETSSYNREEYVEMWLVSIFVQVFYSQGFLRYFMQYMRWEKNISFKEVIKSLIKEYLKNERYSQINKVIKNILSELQSYVDPNIPASETLLEKPFAEVPMFQSMLTIEERLTFWLATNIQHWFSEFEIYVSEKYCRDEVLMDLLVFQKNTIIDYSYDVKQGREFFLHNNWSKYFSDLDKSGFVESTLEPCEKRYRITQETTGPRQQFKLDWVDKENNSEKLTSFLEAVTGSVYTFSGRNLFSQIY